MPSNQLILCHPLLLLPSMFPSIRVFSSESALRIRWPKYWSFSLSISPSNEYSGLISFRMDWLDLLAVQGTLKSILQHHSSKASILLYSAFFKWQEYTEELYKKDLHDPDNHDGVITDLDPDILECEVKWALESIITNKASGGDGIPVELKDDAMKVLHSMCQQIWKTQQWPQDWKRSVFILIPKKGNAEECSNYHTIALISWFFQ